MKLQWLPAPEIAFTFFGYNRLGNVMSAVEYSLKDGVWKIYKDIDEFPITEETFQTKEAAMLHAESLLSEVNDETAMDAG